MPSRPVVMISSTAKDLPEHREQVRIACEQAGFAPHEMMEHLPARDANAVNVSLEMVEDADVYLGIFAFRYGYVPDGFDNSITEMEYDRAVEKNKPRLIFFMDEDHPITPKMVETGDAPTAKLNALKERAGKDRVVGYFKNPDNLHALALASLNQLKPNLDRKAIELQEAVVPTHGQNHHKEQPPESIGPNPYVGLGAFRIEDSDRFFGREDLIKDLWQQFATLHGQGYLGDTPTRLLAILGASGSGKSSVAQAGLLAEIQNRPLPSRPDPKIAVFTPEPRPLESLSLTLARLATDDVSPVGKAQEFEDILRKRDKADGLRFLADSLPGKIPIILLVDQFEEVYSLCDDKNERLQFINNLMNAARQPDGPLSVLLTLRSDFLGAVNDHQKFSKLIAAQNQVVPVMGEKELRRAIEEPAKAAGRPLDPAAVDLLIGQSAREQGALPLLEFALSRIWDGLREGKAEAETLRMLGGVGGALANEATSLFQGLQEKEQAIAKRAFLAMVRLGEGTRDTRRRTLVEEIVTVSENRNDVDRVLDLFSDPGRRLITLSGTEQGKQTVELSHEALIDHWSELKGWLDRERDDLRFHRRLNEASKLWREGRGGLWGSPDLDLLKSFELRNDQELTQVEHAFSDASKQAEIEERNRAREQLRLQEEHEKAEATAKNLRRLVLAAGIGLILTGIAAGFALNEQRIAADSAAKAAHNESLALTAMSGLEHNEGKNLKAAQFALAAWPRSPADNRPKLAATLSSLGDALSNQRLMIPPMHHEGGIWNVLFSDDETKILTSSDDGTARLFNADTGEELIPPMRHDDTVWSAAFSKDETKVLTRSDDGTARLFNADTGEELIPPMRHEGGIWNALFSDDETKILTSSDDGTARLFNADTGEQLIPPMRHVRAVQSVAFSKDETKILTGSDDGTARLFNADTGEELIPPMRHEGPVQSATFSKDETKILTRSDDGTARLFNADTGKQLIPPMRHEGPVQSAAFSKDETKILTGSDDGTARLFNADTGEQLIPPMRHDDTVWSAAFSKDETKVLTRSDDGTARLFNADTGEELIPPMRHEGGIWNALFSDDETKILTSSDDGTARLFNADTGEELIPPMRHEGPVQSATFSKDETKILTGSDDGTARLFSTKNGKEIFSPINLKTHVKNAGFIKNGTNFFARTNTWIVVFDTITGRELNSFSHNGRINSVAFNREGTRILTSSGGDPYEREGMVNLFDASNGQTLFTKFEDTPVWGAVFNKDESQILTYSAEGTARLLDAETGEGLIPPMRQEGQIWSADFNNDETKILTISNDGTARVFDADTGEELTPPMRHDAAVRSAAFSNDDTKILTSSDDGTARLFSAETGEELIPPMRHEESVNSAVFSKDDTKILTRSDGTARVFSAETGEELMPPMRHEGLVRSVVFSADESKILTSSDDGTARLFDASYGEELIPVLRHDAAVESAVFSNDETRILTRSSDGTARLFDAAFGEELIPPMRHGGAVFSVEFSEDETKILTTSGDDTVRVWDISRLPKGDLFDIACRFYLEKGGLDLSGGVNISGFGELKISIADPICVSPPPKPNWAEMQ